MAKKKMTLLDKIATSLVLIGAFNWGLIGLLGFNLVTAIFSTGTVTAVIYILVGLSAVYSGYELLK
jgi:uncharacterized membrane protein YuzA (DUF378 family)